MNLKYEIRDYRKKTLTEILRGFKMKGIQIELIRRGFLTINKDNDIRPRKNLVGGWDAIITILNARKVKSNS